MLRFVMPAILTSPIFQVGLDDGTVPGVIPAGSIYGFAPMSVADLNRVLGVQRWAPWLARSGGG